VEGAKLDDRANCPCSRSFPLVRMKARSPQVELPKASDSQTTIWSSHARSGALVGCWGSFASHPTRAPPGIYAPSFVVPACARSPFDTLSAVVMMRQRRRAETTDRSVAGHPTRCACLKSLQDAPEHSAVAASDGYLVLHINREYFERQRPRRGSNRRYTPNGESLYQHDCAGFACNVKTGIYEPRRIHAYLG
jgi:hypothetical protein